jgi:hypothetical protein
MEQTDSDTQATIRNDYFWNHYPVAAMFVNEERIRNCLHRQKLLSVGQLIQESRQDLRRIVNLGEKSIDRIESYLTEVGLSLADSNLGNALNEAAKRMGYELRQHDVEKAVNNATRKPVK